MRKINNKKSIEDTCRWVFEAGVGLEEFLRRSDACLVLNICRNMQFRIRVDHFKAPEFLCEGTWIFATSLNTPELFANNVKTPELFVASAKTPKLFITSVKAPEFI